MSIFVWLFIALVMGLAEALLPSLITLWFLFGALAAFLVSILGASVTVQLVVFFAVSVISLIALRPLALKCRKKGTSEEPTYVGQTAEVSEDIDTERMSGRVRTADNLTWKAISTHGDCLTKGELVTIVDQQSTKLIVERKSV